MKGFRVVLVVLLLVTAAIVGLAYYQGWFYVTVDKGKFQEDKKTLEQMQDFAQPVKHKTASPTENRTDQ
jgi:uncharacterized membrane protein (DUF106 family)